MNEPSILERVEKLEQTVREIHRTRWDMEYPPGHSEREARMPRILRDERKDKACHGTDERHT